LGEFGIDSREVRPDDDQFRTACGHDALGTVALHRRSLGRTRLWDNPW
jgi:hypothetical protein